MEEEKRISVKLKCPNPLFEKWLTEWRDEARESETNAQFIYTQALKSLERYPLPLAAGRDCKILKGFGDKICGMLDDKLKEYNAAKSEINICKSKSHMNSKKSPGKKKGQEYMPATRSGAYAIMLALYRKSLEPGYIGYCLKKDIISEGKQFCDKSFVKPDPGTYYTAWSSMKTLLDKNLVIKKSNPAQFSLTDAGKVLSIKLNEMEVKQNENCVPIVPMTTENVHDFYENPKPKKSSKAIKKTISTTSTSSTTSEPIEKFLLGPNTFDIILLVDSQETCGTTVIAREDPVKTELQRLKIPFEVRHLKVGDYTWVAREHGTGRELVLPYIVERKRLDDLGASIKDGRFHEQKFRLKQSGIQNVIYLIEKYGDCVHTGLPLTSLQQAATNTLIQDGFAVKFTESLRGTAEYLTCVGIILNSQFKEKTLVSCLKENLLRSSIEDNLVPLMVFQEFNKASSKSKSIKVRDMFVKQLLQLKGMSVDRALAIVENYPTPSLLQKAYSENLGVNGEKLLAPIEYGNIKKKIGPVISKTVYQLYTLQTFR